MERKLATMVVPGDKIEASGGIFTVTEARRGLNNTVCLRGTVGGNQTDWASYPDDVEFLTLTVH